MSESRRRKEVVVRSEIICHVDEVVPSARLMCCPSPSPPSIFTCLFYIPRAAGQHYTSNDPRILHLCPATPEAGSFDRQEHAPVSPWSVMCGLENFRSLQLRSPHWLALAVGFHAVLPCEGV